MGWQLYHSIKTTAGGIRRTGIDMLLPPQCPVTGEYVGASGELSATGWSGIHFIDEPYCDQCGVPFAADYGDDVLCPSCIAARPVFDRARAAVVYDDASHKLVVSFKHSDRADLAPMFARWMTRAGEDLSMSNAVVVPIPLHRRRLFARRYNQSALLARQITKQTGAAMELSALRRIRATPPQKDLSVDARRRNVAGAFEVSQKALARIKGAHVILIDDVLTTGATLSAAARALRKAGAARVDALVLARVVKGGVGAI